jgi:MFS family permease
MLTYSPLTLGRYDQGVMSGIITEPMFLKVFPQMVTQATLLLFDIDQGTYKAQQAPKNKSGAIQALVVAIYEIGCLIGSLTITGIGDMLGRRRAVLVGTLIMLVGTAIQASSTTLAQLIIGRIGEI